MADGQARHCQDLSTRLPVAVEGLEPLEETLKILYVTPPLPGGLVQATQQQQIVHLMGLQLHRRRGEQPQAAEAAVRLQVL